MPELVFDRTQVLAGEAGELARVEPSESAEQWGRILAAGGEFEIGRHGHHGWAFQVQDGAQPLWRFHAGWRRGGKLEGAGADLRLSASLVHAGRWKLKGRDQGSVRIQRQDARSAARSPGSGGGVVVLSGLESRPLVLDADGAFWETRDGLVALTFACWLIDEWEAMPNVGGSPM
jgi:hypothetical protein